MKKIQVVAVMSALLLAFMAGCKSAKVVEQEPPEAYVHPLAMLSDDLSIYMSVPVKEHRELITKIVSTMMDGMTEENAGKICDRSETLYSGLGRVKDRSHLETASWTSVPKIAVSSLMTKKNGFEKEIVHFDEGDMAKYKSSASGFEVAFPSTKILCFSQNLDPMLEKFSRLEPVSDAEYNNWINRESKDILFYITRPGQYLRNLIGQSINIGTDKIYGSLSYKPDPKKPGQYSGRYNLSFYIHLTNKKAASALKGLLSLSFSMMGGSVEQTDAETLYLSGIEVSDNQIKDLFMRDPITGKHYRVVGEDVIEESVKK
ncbi:hypothetical protein [Treponema sp.]|uniref:hypothetical protein n=1 Tax=Treponema sp. TaxID=166 RepID=UPI0038909CE2